MRTILIDKKEYKIDCNALTYVKYKDIFNRGILNDIQFIREFLTKKQIMEEALKEADMKADEINTTVSSLLIKDLDSFVEIITKIAYIMIYSFDNKTIDKYENWLKEIKKLKISDDWIAEVTEFAVDCFC